MREPLIFNVIAPRSGMGKTTLVTSILKILSEKKLRVASVKHLGDKPFDTPQKDTFKHLSTGSKAVAALTKDEIIFIYKQKETPKKLESSIITMNAMFPPGLDVVIVEGFKQHQNPAIVIAGTNAEVKQLAKNRPIIFVTGPVLKTPAEADKTRKDFTLIPSSDKDKMYKEISKYGIRSILKQTPMLDCGDCGYKSCAAFAKAVWAKQIELMNCPQLTGKLVLEIDGEVVPIKQFVQDIIAKGIYGMITSLRGIPPHPKKITITLHS
jgi:molybdopterin-guanine dinucleotide biosynthesis protein B